MSLDKFKLNGEIVIVTGGLGLLGTQYCKAITEIGGNPIVLDTREPGMNVECYGRVYHCDITNEEQIKQALAEIKETTQNAPIYGLINNAAIDPKFEKDSQNTPKSRLECYSLEQWNKEVSVGLTGAFLCTKHFGAEMAKNGRGSIVNISSVLGHIAPNQNLYRKEPYIEETKDFGDKIVTTPENQQPVKPVTYSVIKHAIIGLTRWTATYWATNGVRCNALSPGGVYNGHSTDFVEKLSKYVPLGRMAIKDEYNSAIQFLLTDASSFMTGAVLQIDGGQSTW